MPAAKLTQRFVHSAAAEGRDQIFWDADLTGFGLKVTRGGAKIYVIQYRMGGRGTPTRRYTLGAHDSPWSPVTARAEAGRLLRLAKSGVDPQQAERERQHDAVELAFNRYVERFLRDYAKPKWKPRYYASGESNVRRWLLPVLGSQPVNKIGRRDIARVLDRVPAESRALRQALFAFMRKMFAWALQRGDIERSPFEGLKGPPPARSRERVLDEDELVAVMLATFDPSMAATFGPMVRFLAITGQRRDEVARMSWDELNRKDRVWVIPGERTKNGLEHVLPLSTLMLAALNQIAGSEDWPRSGPVFTTNGRTPISGYSRMKARLDRIAATHHPDESIKPWRLHDLRRTVATNLQRLGVRFEVTEAILNHISGSRSGVSGVYQRHDWRVEKAEALELWSRTLHERFSTSRLKDAAIERDEAELSRQQKSQHL